MMLDTHMCINQVHDDRVADKILKLQGRYGKGTGQEYLKYFMVEYKRPGTHTEWRLYTDKNSQQVRCKSNYFFHSSSGFIII